MDTALESDLRDQIAAKRADPDFVLFVMAWHGVVGAAEAPFTAEKQSQSYKRKIKRWVQRDFKSDWLFYWKVILDEGWKVQRQVVLKRNLFKMEPPGPQPNHRPREDGRWNAIFDLRNYFKKATGKPQMELLRQLFYPKQQVETFRAEWKGRKDWFKNENGAARLKDLELFYRHNRDRIIEAFRTGVPIYAKWEMTQPIVQSNVLIVHNVL